MQSNQQWTLGLLRAPVRHSDPAERLVPESGRVGELRQVNHERLIAPDLVHGLKLYVQVLDCCHQLFPLTSRLLGKNHI